jgi:hypothetical protein
MDCPTCGAQLSQALSYCNRCGANLSLVKDQGGTKDPRKTIDNIAGSMVSTAILILGMILGALVLMKKGHIAEELGIVFVLMSALTLLVLEGIFTGQLRRLNKGVQEVGGTTARSKDFKTEELGAGSVHSLAAPVEPLTSVTEPTTRTLEPIYSERKAD